MPHMIIRMQEGINAEQKKKLVEDTCLAIMGEHARPGRRMAYELYEIPTKHLAIGGKFRSGSPLSAYLISYLPSEIPNEQRAVIAKDATKAIAKNLGCPLDEVRVEFVDLYPENVAHGGALSV
jgi:phenylpyruvate tautomerase PptA (4-oxalocrotonate tautomerase family)